jgi:phosphatidate cytidylyltransferase
MTALFTGAAVFDAWLDGSLTGSAADDAKLRATLLYVVMAIVTVRAQLELAELASRAGVVVFTVPVTAASVLLAGCWYWRQLAPIGPGLWALAVLVAALPLVMVWQYFRRGTSGVFANCGASLLAIAYLGLFGLFVLAIRIDFGVLALLMYVFTVKTADIGAYTAGSLFGLRRFCPVISPGKTWEGMAGAVAAAVLFAVGFAAVSGIMTLPRAAAFGAGFAFVGQAGDLAESMLKRDAGRKDSARDVPGFGGVLDIVDSPLAAAPFAYLFFTLAC